jgi:DNA-binding NarL/FixJ family response regulator
MATKTKVLIVDDHPLFRQGVRWNLEAAEDVHVVGEAENGQEAIKLSDRYLPDVVLVDINLPGLNGLEVARVIKRHHPSISIIILSVYEDDDQLFQAIKVGAAAYSSKDVHPQDLLTIIRQVSSGNYLINDRVMAKPHVATRILSQFREQAASEEDPMNALFAPLTSREIEILDCIARGLSNKEIAGDLNISSQTVKNHITSILKKLQVDDRTRAVMYAIKQGWIRMGYPGIPTPRDEPGKARK